MSSIAPVLFRQRRPKVRLLDVKSDVSDLTTYTFTNCNLGELGSNPADAITAPRYIRSSSNRALLCIVHSADAATVWTVNSVTVGGVALSSGADHGGNTNSVSTAIFTTNMKTLEESVASETVEVTFSEPVTSCAIALVMVDGVRSPVFSLGTSTGTGTGVVNSGTGSNNTNPDNISLLILGSTCLGTTENFIFETGGSASRFTSLEQPTLLYQSSNAEIAFAAIYSVSMQYPGFDASINPWQIATDWSGTSAHSLAIGVMT